MPALRPQTALHLLIELVCLEFFCFEFAVKLRTAFVQHGRARGHKEGMTQDGLGTRPDLRVGVQHELQ